MTDTWVRTTRPRRRHPATGGRIVAVGIGATTMFGLNTVKRVAQASSSSTTTTPTDDAPMARAPGSANVQIVGAAPPHGAPAPIATTGGSG